MAQIYTCTVFHPVWWSELTFSAQKVLVNHVNMQICTLALEKLKAVKSIFDQRVARVALHVCGYQFSVQLTRKGKSTYYACN